MDIFIPERYEEERFEHLNTIFYKVYIDFIKSSRIKKMAPI